jgi:hypothetical protein
VVEDIQCPISKRSSCPDSRSKNGVASARL